MAPQLTALFDGEADALQTDDARAHLLSCPACSRLWLDWTQHRAILQSEPVPPPPPTLLWRVLIAYRVAAFAQPARRRSQLPSISAAALRGIEAPLPPRLSQHILARTTRRPSAHVMLTPLGDASLVANARWRTRASRFRRASLWAAPALALWVLMLARTDFTATVPIATPSVPTASIPVRAETSTSFQEASTARTGEFALIPVASSLSGATSAEAPSEVTARLSASPADFVSRPAIKLAGVNARAQTSASASGPQLPRVRAADAAMNRALLLAMSAGQHDITRAETVPVVAQAPVARVRTAAVVEVALPAPRAALSDNARLNAPPATTSHRPLRVASRAPLSLRPSPVDSANVSLAALTAPLSPIRTVSNARFNAGVFSEDSTQPRVTYASAGGRRLARALPDEGEATLRVSRPIAGTPTLRTVRISGDNGPRIEDLRSAVDDFRASVSSEHFGDE